ncbi:MAG TPA: hypothetical protein VN736_13150 [Candidatus Limnocylindrales bacterium]|nr:hypothetical protein [Candidatus Limnocylindrales bacterium]
MTFQSRFCIAAVLVSAAALSGCSKLPGGGDSEPFRTPKYPPHAAVQPSVDPSTFTSGPAYDWEHPSDWPNHTSSYTWWNFSSARAFPETAAWIANAMNEYVAKNNSDPQQRFSDFHFRGCLVEWHEEQGLGTNHVNEYNYSVNLAHANMSQMFASGTDQFRIGWTGEDDPQLGRYWEIEDGRWKNLGERVQPMFNNRDFPVTRKDMIAPLTIAFLHAARLCGAKR